MLSDFVQTYYINPILYGTGYNIVNTLTYALILIAAAFGTYHLLRRMQVRVDANFLFGIAPFVALGGMLRALEDYYEASGFNELLAESVLKPFIVHSPVQGKILNVLLITPLMYITMFVIALACLLVALLASKKLKLPYHRIWFLLGIALAALVALQYRIVDWYAAGLMLGVFSFWVAATLAAKHLSKKRFPRVDAFLTQENMLLILVHMFDASTTFVATQYYPYVEQHVVPQFFIGIFGPAVMFFLKLPVIALVLYYLDKDLRHEKEKRSFLKIVVMILGLGPGLRNFFRLAMHV